MPGKGEGIAGNPIESYPQRNRDAGCIPVAADCNNIKAAFPGSLCRSRRKEGKVSSGALGLNFLPSKSLPVDRLEEAAPGRRATPVAPVESLVTAEEEGQVE